MSYLPVVYLYLTTLVLGVAGIVLLSLGARNLVKEYAKAQEAMKRRLTVVPRGRVSTSRALSPTPNTNRSQAA